MPMGTESADSTIRESGRVWLVTGASRGMGASFVAAVLDAGHRVVATARRPETVHQVFGVHERLAAVALDVTHEQQAEQAVAAAVKRFGRLDVLVNSAGASFKGYFEEMSPAQVSQQLAVNLLGPMHVTRAALPVMRAQRSGQIIAISSGAGLMGFEYSSVYAAAKAGLEGWMSALTQEVAPFGIDTMVVNPGFFRTGLAGPESLVWPEVSVEDYAERSAAQREWWQAQDGRQAGDPDKLARAVVALSGGGAMPRRFIAGADVLAIVDRKVAELQSQASAHRDLSLSLGVDDQ
jgi:NAD(P)-dependent dehydrogenase (short-subunit alcohol dehydrogenase family)